MPTASPRPTSISPCPSTIRSTALAARAERHAHAELLRALRHRRRDHARDAGHRHQQRQRREHRQQHRRQLRRREIASRESRRASGRSPPACSDRSPAPRRESAPPPTPRIAGRAHQHPPAEPCCASAAAACRPARPPSLVEPELPHVADDADDGGPRLPAVERHARADRIGLVPVPHHRPVDDDHRLRSRPIRFGERPPAARAGCRSSRSSSALTMRTSAVGRLFGSSVDAPFDLERRGARAAPRAAARRW